MAGTGGFRLAGASTQLAKVEGSSGSSTAAVEPVALKTPAIHGNGGTSVMNGEADGSLRLSTLVLRLLRGGQRAAGRRCCAAAPSMKTSPARPFAPALPLKSQVA